MCPFLKEDFERYMSTELKYFLAIGAHIKEGLAIEPQVEERSGVSWLSLLHLHDSLLAGDLPLPKGATRLHNSSAGAV